jgi:superfamily II DNA or RNA helicase
LVAGLHEGDDLMSYLFSHMAPEIKAAPVPKIIARPYQTAAIEAAFREWETVSSTLIVLPTGTGKSVVFAKILKRWLENKEHYGRVMILAHRKELIAQAREHALSAGATCEIEMAGEYAKKADVVAASVQTLNAGRDCFTCDNVNSGDCHTCGGSGRVKRVTRFDPRDFGLIITDEGHHGTAASYMDVYTWFGSNPDNKRLFVTATPERADGEGLHNVCESVAYEMGLKAAIDEGWLCPIRQQFIEVDGLDLSRVSTRQGDLADGELQRAFIGENDIEQEKLLHAIAKPVLETAAGQQFIVFATGVEHATLLQAAFNAYDGAKVEMILGSTDPFERVEIVKRLRNGTTQGLVNVGVATEGFDCPAVAVVAIARPTKSTSLYMQMIGRGTRPLPGVVDGPETPEERRAAIAASAKTSTIVMDFVGNSGNHKLVSVLDVLAGDDVDARDIAEAIRVTKAQAEPEDMQEALEKAKQAREERERKAEEMRQAKQSTYNKADRVQMRAVDVDLFDGGGFDAFRDYTPEHHNDASVKQVAYLVKLGISPEKATTVSKRQAGAMIDKLTSKTGGEYIISFGKHKGNPINKIPAGWLNWAVQNLNSPEIVGHIQQYRSGADD